MKYTHFFFDLDGTIINSAPGITHSVQYAVQKMGIEPPPAEELTVFIGPPLALSFSKVFGMTDEQAKQAVAFYRENYRAGGMLECEVYEGIPQLLQALHDAGAVCVLATCKPHEFAKKILEHFGLDRYFDLVSGPEMDGTRGEKHEVIAHAMQILGLTDPANILMIGDRDNDVLGARHHCIDCAGALWGFGSEDELTDAGAKMICQTPQDLKNVL